MIGPRTRFFDDIVLTAIRDGVRQVVLMAAGTDTRVFRLALPADAVTFELDQAVVLEEKQEVLDREHATPMCRDLVLASKSVQETWGTRGMAELWFPDAARDPDFRHWLARSQRHSVRPRDASTHMRDMTTIDRGCQPRDGARE